MNVQAEGGDVNAISRKNALEALAREEWQRTIEECDRALALRADAVLHNCRARALGALGRNEDALRAIERALEMDPASAADLRNRFVLLRRLGRHAEALSTTDILLTLLPDDPDGALKRAQALLELERREEALDCAQKALQSHPVRLAALNVRGMVLERLGRYEEALADFRAILESDETNTDGLNNSGMAQARLGRFREALEFYDRSLEVKPDQPQAVHNRSIVRLALGDWTRGFREFESRWSALPLCTQQPLSTKPLWLGNECVRHKTLLLCHEQGYGDTLQFLRYVPLVLERGATVVLQVPPALCELASTLEPSVSVVSLTDPVPPHDLYCPLMSLALAFGTTPQSIPGATPYLRSDPVRARTWGKRLTRRHRLRVGIVWRGRAYPPVNYPRDLPIEALRRLIAIDADFVSLQKDLSEAEQASLRSVPNLDISLAVQLGDFADTAALIDNLDLVIAVDSAVAHLAGALGKPVWLLNRFASCWRWLQEGTETAWYRTMKIFRQPSIGDWDSVVNAVERDLKELAASPSTKLGATCHGDQPRSTAKGKAIEASRSNRMTIRLVCATRLRRQTFFQESALGRSIPFYRHFPIGQRIELRLFPENEEPLANVYNRAIEESRKDPAILVFVHDDVYLSDYHWARRLQEALDEFDMVGLAGNRRRVPRQASWMYLDDRFTRDSYDNLSGVIGHGGGFPNLIELSAYGDPGQEVRLLDGVLLAIRSDLLLRTDLRFDPQFAFHFYDLDFCRQAERRGIRMGTWAISAIHASAGKLGGEGWRAAYEGYLAKYGEC